MQIIQTLERYEQALTEEYCIIFFTNKYNCPTCTMWISYLTEMEASFNTPPVYIVTYQDFVEQANVRQIYTAPVVVFSKFGEFVRTQYGHPVPPSLFYQATIASDGDTFNPSEQPTQ